MRTEATVGLLRKLLTDRGHILPTKSHPDSKCIILNHGEYLVSLMSQDGQLMDLLNDLDSAFGLDWIKDDGDLSVDCNVQFLVGCSGADFDLWVDTIKFIWFSHGVTEALRFIKATGIRIWSKWTIKQREVYVDSLVLIAQKRLRSVGVKHREMANFFADPGSAKALSEPEAESLQAILDFTVKGESFYG
jgi:hypothetical protein